MRLRVGKRGRCPLFGVWCLVSERGEQGFAAGDFAGAGALLDLEALHSAVLDDHRIAARARDKACGGRREIHSNGFGEGRICVGQHGETCRSGASGFAPSFHHEGVVDRDADDFIHAFGGELVLGADETWHMGGVASRGECAGHGEKRDCAAFQLVGQRYGLGAFVAHLYHGGFGQLITDCYGHVVLPRAGLRFLMSRI